MTASFTKKLTINSSALQLENCVLFGGTGFIGTHFTRFLLANNLAKTITLADIEPPRSLTSRAALNDPRVRYVPINICQPIQHSHLPARTDLVLNFAAIHREPGHKPHEYFKTNLQGAENVCQWAESVGCKTIAFTSSISLYGPTEEQKNEQSTPIPVTAYGASKLAAEKIHRDWQRGGRDTPRTAALDNIHPKTMRYQC
jgi:GlcNAc-P-P-Und epimerase